MAMENSAGDSHRRRPRRRTAAGAVPGTLIAAPGAAKTNVEVIAFGPDGFERIVLATKELATFTTSYPAVWVNVTGLADLDVLTSLGTRFNLHDLALEDVINTHQRPKAEEYDDHVFIVARMPLRNNFSKTEQLALFVGGTFVITFQEKPGDWFDLVRSRITENRGRIRRSGADYLAYALLDAVVDSYFPVIEQLGEEIDKLETFILGDNSGDALERLHRAKRKLITFRRAIWPHREMLNALMRTDSLVFGDTTQVYLRDCYDHIVQLMDVIETDRELISDLFDIHLSRVNLRMNEIMKVLTIIATVFIPLGFVASVYGMNFDRSVSPWNMPELAWRFGYPFALGLMAAIGGGLIYFLYRRGWLTRDEGNHRRSAPKSRGR
ncbi:MAG: magnesium/cobalt transporter CorA [Alphaproteobacteria bacterium]|nr:magnesium/cobalt transporter CorA [Alphaproteobacteria bacterium]